MSAANPLYGRRSVFVGIYCGQRGWNRHTLTKEQVNEIRVQPGWIDPAPPGRQLKAARDYQAWVNSLWLAVVGDRPAVTLTELIDGLERLGVNEGGLDGIIESIAQIRGVVEMEDGGDINYLNLGWAGCRTTGFEDCYHKEAIDCLPSPQAEFDGVGFADQTSRLNACLAMYWVARARMAGDESFRPPMVIIHGSQGCGKTRLVKLICGDGVPCLDGATGRHLDGVAPMGVPAVCIDDFRMPISRGRINVAADALNDLCRFITGHKWQVKPVGRKPGKKPGGIYNLRTVIFMTVNDVADLPADLVRRSVFIRLNDFVPDVNAFGDSDWGSTPD